MQGWIQGLQEFEDCFWKEVAQEAEHISQQDMPKITEELFALFEKTGNRIKYEAVYFGRRKFLTIWGLTALMEQETSKKVSEETIKKLVKVIKSVCEEECWALPAHVNRAENANWRVTVDLFASETAQTLAELVDRFQEELPSEVYQLVVDNVEKRVFIPFFNSSVGYYEWEQAEHNWNAVCGGSIGSACLHLLRKQPERLEKYLQRICKALPHYIDGFTQDGACLEGLGYFTYGMSYFTNFAQELYEYTGGKQDLFCGKWGSFLEGKEDKRSKIAAFQGKCYFSDGQSISFSDGNSKEHFRVGLSLILEQHYSQISLPGIKQAAGLHEDSCYRFAPLKMDLLQTRKWIKKRKGSKEIEKIEPIKEIEKEKIKKEEIEKTNSFFHILPYAQWCIGGAENGVGMACKGGHNNEPHNHNDIGHFIYEAKGEMLLTDLGAGEYTKEYFGEGRYQILCNQSFGHSVPVIDGEGQQPGKEFCCSRFEAKEDGSVLIEFPKAYQKGLIEGLCREIKFSKKTGELTLQDEFVMNNTKEHIIKECFVTQLLPQQKGNEIWLKGEAVTGRIILEEKEAPFITIQECLHSNHQGIEEKVYRIEWSVPLKENAEGKLIGKSKVRIAVI